MAVSKKEKWSADLCEFLHSYPILYDRRHPAHYDQLQTLSARTVIAELMNDKFSSKFGAVITEEDINKKIRSVRADLAKLQREKKSYTGKGADEVRQKSWTNSALFLLPHILSKYPKETPVKVKPASTIDSAEAYEKVGSQTQQLTRVVSDMVVLDNIHSTSSSTSADRCVPSDMNWRQKAHSLSSSSDGTPYNVRNRKRSVVPPPVMPPALAGIVQEVSSSLSNAFGSLVEAKLRQLPCDVRLDAEEEILGVLKKYALKVMRHPQPLSEQPALVSHSTDISNAPISQLLLKEPALTVSPLTNILKAPAVVDSDFLIEEYGWFSFFL